VAIGIARIGGDADTVGPVTVGIGLLGGIVLGALVGIGVGRLLRGLLTRR
jgi:NhaP-type Na+/H+ or K+/H+ antiporter